jgi:hypothetical protein
MSASYRTLLWTMNVRSPFFYVCVSCCSTFLSIQYMNYEQSKECFLFPTSEEKNFLKVLSDHTGSYKALEFLSKKLETSGNLCLGSTWQLSTVNCREACRDTQTSIRLASHLVREPNSRSGGHEFVSPLTKVERFYGVRTFHNIMPVYLSAWEP